jgi:hypothetical protein
VTSLEEIQRQLGGNIQPPVHLWNPDLCGDIDITIKRNGDWFHLGSKIKRHALVKLFASILRKEVDGNYYLVTPVEKLRIEVEQCALIGIDIEAIVSDKGVQQLCVSTNVDTAFIINDERALIIEQGDADNSGEPLPMVMLPNGLSARLSRSAFYRLVNLAFERDGALYITSDGCEFKLGDCS